MKSPPNIILPRPVPVSNKIWSSLITSGNYVCVTEGVDELMNVLVQPTINICVNFPHYKLRFLGLASVWVNVWVSVRVNVWMSVCV